MKPPADSANPPLAEPGKRPSGANVGGISASADSGLADWAQRSTERGDAPAVGQAATGDGAGAAASPRVDLGGKAAPGSAPGATGHNPRPGADDRAAPTKPAARDTTAEARGVRSGDDEDEWRHPPVAPVDERNPLRSLGKAVADTLTNSDPQMPHRPPER